MNSKSKNGRIGPRAARQGSKPLSPMQRARVQRGVTLAHLAQHTGLDISTLSRIERGQIETSVTNAEAIAQALGHAVTVIEILDPDRFTADACASNDSTASPPAA